MTNSEVNQKIRLRTEDDLRAQNLGLIEIRDMLNEIQLPYFLAGGTLLGIIRENDFIKWDWDVEINVRTEEARPKLELLKSRLIENGFEIIKCKGDPENFKLTVCKFDSKYEIIGYYLQDDKRMRGRYQMPARFFQKECVINLRDEPYKTFYQPEEYLSHTYGDWETPRRTTDSQVYLNKGFHRQQVSDQRNFIYRFLKWFINKGKHLKK